MRSGIPKVPSLLFDMELEEGGKSTHSSEEMDVQLVEAELRRFLRPSSPALITLTSHVDAVELSEVDAASNLEKIRKTLQHCGYSICLRRALGGGEGSLCLHNLRHTFLSASYPGVVGASFVVDPSFADQFQIAKPTLRYESILACLPSVLVIPEDRIPPLVTFLCAELAAAFKASNTVVPPWRQAGSMLSKWQPRKSMDLPSTDITMPARRSVEINNDFKEDLQPKEEPDQQVDINALGQQCQGSAESMSTWPAAGKALISAALHVKPAVMEPNRVYGGFSSFGCINLAT